MNGYETRLLVIIPAYNEAPRLGAVIDSVREQLGSACILVVDDCSVDTTRRVARSAGAVVISHAVNLGYGAALETGYLFAIRHEYDIVVQMDGDGQHLAEEIPKILQPVLDGAADLVIGSRYAEGATAPRTSRARRLGQMLLSGVFSAATGRKIADPTSGFQCLGAKALNLYTKTLFPCDYPDVDVLLTAHYAGLSVREVAVKMVERSEGVSIHSGLRPVYYMMKMLLSIFLVVLGYKRWKDYVS